VRRLTAQRLSRSIDELAATGPFSDAVDAVARGSIDPYAAVDSLLAS
jgi:hypothetical protein